MDIQMNSHAPSRPLSISRALHLPLPLLTALLLAPLAALLAAEPVTIDLSKRTWQGIPGLERTANGRVFISWFTGGPKEPAPENTVLLSYSDDAGKTFTAPAVIALPTSDGTRCYDPTLWIDPKGRLWYVFNRGNEKTAQHDVWARICDAPSATPPAVGAEFRVGFESPYAFRMNKPTVLSTGEWIMPVTHATETIHSWFAGPKQLQGVGISTDEGKTWKLHGALKAPHWALECMITELKDGRLWLLTRTGGGFLWESHSTGKGRNWSEAKASTIANPGSRFFIRRLASGHLLLVNHYKFTGRSHLNAQLSTDDGATWNDGLLLDERSGVSYPDGVQDKDGLIWITYDRDRGGAGEILLAKFKEEDVIAGRNVSGSVSLKQVVNKLDKPSLLPTNWNPALAGDIVMQRLVKVTAPQVKGAHDAEFVCVGERAYIVEHDNDVAPGHGSGEAMYCVLTVVNLKTLKVEKTHLLAKAGQAFANITLPQAQVFVPRIIRKDEHTLRTYFCSKSANEQTWYRDFDLRTQSFAESIHQAKLKTAAGTFDMEPRHFHADAAAQGFKRPPVNHGLYIFDSFKEFDGRRYVALNNFPGKQNALAVLHDDFTTFEVIGHYNEPQSQQLSESAVNRLPDGTWMAICRNDAGNYHFTTSKDGKNWTIGQPMPFVPNGLNSKPTFDKFGGVYHLGWQENTKIQDCNRSVFNVDISRDGKTWQRKYRFESPHSLQYPTFHEHEGTIWLTVTQSDHKGSSDRIMFGKLENVGQFESQEGKKRIAWPAQPPSAGAALKVAEPIRLWSNSKPVPKTEDLATLPGIEFRVIKPYEFNQDGYRFLHGVGLGFHKGRLYASFGHNQGGENTDTEEARFCTSDDAGKTWSTVATMDAGLEPGVGVSHGVFLSLKGQLWAFHGAYSGTMEKVHARAYLLDETRQTWQPKGTVIEGGFWPLEPPVKMTDGNWIMSGFSVGKGNPAAVAISHGDNMLKWDLVVIPLATDLGKVWGESSVIVEGKRITNTARYGEKPFALVSVSEDYGRTWTSSQRSNLPMATSKPSAGVLSTGQRYLICSTSADGGARRSPLTIAVSRPGETLFSKVFVIRQAVFPEGPGESHKSAALSYPCAIEHDGKLYVGYSNNGGNVGRVGTGRELWNNSSAELAIIPIKSLRFEP